MYITYVIDEWKNEWWIDGWVGGEIRRADSLSVSLFAFVDTTQDTRNISAKKITRAIGNQMLGPTKVDCWNLKFSNAHDKSRWQNADKKQINNI